MCILQHLSVWPSSNGRWLHAPAASGYHMRQCRSREWNEGCSYFYLPFPTFFHFSPPLPTPFPSLKSTLFWKYVLPPEHFRILKRPSKARPRTGRLMEGPHSPERYRAGVPAALPFGSLGAQWLGRRSATLQEGDGGRPPEGSHALIRASHGRPAPLWHHSTVSSEALALRAPRVKEFQWERARSPPPCPQPAAASPVLWRKQVQS